MNAEYFILDSLWLLYTKYTDFLREDWKMLFNTPENLELSKKERQLTLDYMVKNNLVVVNDGWCKLSSQGGKYWETIFQVNWALFHDCWFEPLCEETEKLDFYCTSKEIMNLFLSQHKSILTGCQIKSLYNWEATYWKILDSGFYLTHKVSTDFNQIGRIQLPKWKLGLDEVIARGCI